MNKKKAHGPSLSSTHTNNQRSQIAQTVSPNQKIDKRAQELPPLHGICRLHLQHMLHRRQQVWKDPSQSQWKTLTCFSYQATVQCQEFRNRKVQGVCASRSSVRSPSAYN